MGARAIHSEIMPDTPIRLALAAELAFPDGSMGVPGLRKEAARGRLKVSRIAGKDYTTLAAVQEMIELCRVHATTKAHGSGFNRSGSTGMDQLSEPSGASSMTEDSRKALAAARIAVQRLKESSNSTSRKSASRSAPATVVPLR